MALVYFIILPSLMTCYHFANGETLLKPFLSISHLLQSGPVELVNNNTIIISNFYYDGTTPDARFWIGKGYPSQNGNTVCHETTCSESLGFYNGKNVTLSLPPNISINTIDYLAVWSSKEQNSFGYVLMTEQLNGPEIKEKIYPIKLRPFRELAHGLKSDTIEILDNQTFFIPNLYYDGRGPDAHFWVGKGVPSQNGTLVPDEKGSIKTLSSYNGQNITIILPAETTIDDIDYIAMWCIDYAQNFGHVFMNEKKHNEFGVQLKPFETSKNNLQSGPVILIDEKTLYIPNLVYSGTCYNAKFWISNGSEASDNRIYMPDDEIQTPLSSYNGQSIYVTLPGIYKISNANYFGVWCVEKQYIIGYINIDHSLEVPKTNTFSDVTNDGKKLIRVPKCCPHGSLTDYDDGCIERNFSFEPLTYVHMSNETYINDEPINEKRLAYAPYISSCRKRYLLEEGDNYILLMNGNLLYLDIQAELYPLKYCFDTLYENDKYVTRPFICYEEEDSYSLIHILHAICITTSIICLIISSGLYCKIKAMRIYAYGKAVVGFTASMAIAYLSLIILQFATTTSTCKVLGFLYQFFIVSAFVWFNVMCYETFYRIKNYWSESVLAISCQRFTFYLCAAVLVPLSIMVISLLLDYIPGIPTQYLENKCDLKSEFYKELFFSVPILVSILINISLILHIKTIIKNNDLEPCLEKLNMWNLEKSAGLWRYRSCVMVTIIMAFCWILEIICIYVIKGSPGVLIELLNCLRGVMIFLVIVLSNPTKKTIEKFYRKNIPFFQKTRPSEEIELRGRK